MEEYSTFPKSPRLEPHRFMVRFISRTNIEGCLIPLVRCSRCINLRGLFNATSKELSSYTLTHRGDKGLVYLSTLLYILVLAYLISLFNGISIFVVYLMRKPPFDKDNRDIIEAITGGGD